MKKVVFLSVAMCVFLGVDMGLKMCSVGAIVSAGVVMVARWLNKREEVRDGCGV